MNIADEAQDRYGRKVSWGVEVGGERILFTHIAVPVMTRLKQPERQVLDTLVDAGVARSRSDALAWSVKLVGEHTEEWLAKLRDAMSAVDDLRARGPRALAFPDLSGLISRWLEVYCLLRFVGACDITRVGDIACVDVFEHRAMVAVCRGRWCSREL